MAAELEREARAARRGTGIARSGWRIARLLALHARMDLLWVARSPRVAAAWYAAEAIVHTGLVASTFLLAERFDGIGPWSRDQVLFFLGYALVARGLVDVGFGWNVAFVSRRIGRGQLDHTLLQPQPLWMALATEGFSPASGSGMVLAGGAALAVAGSRLGFVAGVGDIAWLGVELLASTALILAFSYLWACLAFWAPRSAEEINSSTMRLLDQLRGLPLDGLGPAMTSVLVSAVPVGLVAWVPCRALLAEAPSAAELAAAPLAALAFALSTAAVFRRGLRQYGRIGSTRYLALGHRR